ncbi:MAG: AAA family ATPase [Sulfuricellaceae bacterium]|nr:AAA family ATPase [Sulfuricellaceae bacterium]
MSPHQEHLPVLISALARPELHGIPEASIRILETHISYLILAEPYAYKIKKPVNLGFLDFSTLEQRHHFCAEELRLNRRLAPQLYLDVIAITGTPSQPEFNGVGPIIEYAVKMRQFPQEALLDRVLAQGSLSGAQIGQLARTLADFHLAAPAAPSDGLYGTAAHVFHPMQENFEQIRPILEDEDDLLRLEALRVWTELEFSSRRGDIRHRLEQGHIRECHGDLHLGNMLLLDGQVTLFDCIEFNPDLRWIDVISDLAFLIMDLHDRACPALAWQLLNNYLERTGDYTGVKLLRLYQVYRAMVRAKVAAIRLGQTEAQKDRESLRAVYRRYALLAERLAQHEQAALVITHGLSGSGKSWHSAALAEHWGAIRLRSDIERKRLFGLDAGAASQSPLDSGIYTPEAGRETYRQLEEFAATLLRSGYRVIVDASFLDKNRREAFRTLAQTLAAPFAILDTSASADTLRQRILAREQGGADASEAGLAVLEKQLARQEPLTADEQNVCLKIESDRNPPPDDILAGLLPIFRRPQ